VTEHPTVDLAQARRAVAKVYETEQDANRAGEQLRRAGWKVNRITGERIRPDGLLRVATVLHPDADEMPAPVGELLARGRIPMQLRHGDPGQ
jgi:hypothetical protein